MGYQRITMEEREEIFRLRYEDRLFLRETGQKLHKDKSAVSRELKRGTKNKLYNLKRLRRTIGEQENGNPQN